MQVQGSNQQKVCTSCNQSKPLDDFPKNSDGKLGRSSKCRACRRPQSIGIYSSGVGQLRKALRARGASLPAKQQKIPSSKPLIPGQTHKQCAECTRLLPLDSFQRATTSVDGLQRRCRICRSEAAKRRYKELISLADPATRRTTYQDRADQSSGPLVRVCAKCRISRDISEYRSDSDGVDGLDWICKPCRSEEYRSSSREKRDTIGLPPSKICGLCLKDTPIGEFCLGPSPDGLSLYCRTCKNAAEKKRRLDDPAKYAAWARSWREANYNWDRSHRHDVLDREPRRIAGITEEIWLDILALHDGLCGRCGSSEDVELDHIIPYALGGIDEPWNGQALCGKCNSSKRHKEIADYRPLECRLKYPCTQLPPLVPTMRRVKERRIAKNDSPRDPLPATAVTA